MSGYAILVAGAIIADYAVCSFLAYGLFLAAEQRHYPDIRRYSDGMVNLRFGLLYGLLGPIGLLIAFMLSEWGYHGFQFRALTSDYDQRNLHPRNPDSEPQP